MKKFRPKFIYALFFGTLFFTLQIEAVEPSTVKSTIPQVTQSNNNYKLGILTGYSNTSNQGSSLNSVEFGIIGRMALSYKTSVFIEASQGLLTDSLTAGFTSMGLGFEYHIWGENTLDVQTIKLDGIDVIHVKDFSPSIFSMSVMAKQYFFNGSENVFPFTGLGICSRYQFSNSQEDWSPFVSGCYDYLINPPNTSSALRIFFGFDFFI